MKRGTKEKRIEAVPTTGWFEASVSNFAIAIAKAAATKDIKSKLIVRKVRTGCNNLKKSRRSLNKFCVYFATHE